MAPFGLIFNKNRSYRIWEASGMPPGPKNAPRGPRGAQGGPAPLTPGAAGWPLRAYYISFKKVTV